VRVRGRVTFTSGPFAAAVDEALEAYEIHVGRTVVGETLRPFHVVARREAAVSEADGALSDAGNVLGTYLHGLFANGALRRALLAHLASRRHIQADPRWGTSPSAAERYDRLADIVAAACDLSAIGKLVGVAIGSIERRSGQ